MEIPDLVVPKSRPTIATGSISVGGGAPAGFDGPGLPSQQPASLDEDDGCGTSELDTTRDRLLQPMTSYLLAKYSGAMQFGGDVSQLFVVA